MIVRIFAILLALGMIVISTQATDRGALGSADTAAFVDDADELPPVVVVETLTVISDQPPAESVLPSHVAPLGRHPETELFRPPRVAAFV